MLIHNKRAHLADFIRSTGLLRLLEQSARRPVLVVLVYHRIGEPLTDPFYRPLVSATVEGFREQMVALRRSYRVIGLRELEGLIDPAGELTVREPVAMVTFDDGYRDNLTLAAPILRELGLPAVFFLTTGFVGQTGPVLPWWDRAAYAIQHSRRGNGGTNANGREARGEDSDSSELSVLVDRFFRLGVHPEDAGELGELDLRHGVDPQGRLEAAESLFLSRAEVCALADSGFEIGAHTHRHRPLSWLSESDQRGELIGPKNVLESWLGRPVAGVAYPFGSKDKFDATTKRLARETGYRYGFALDPRVARPGPIDALAIPRFAVSPGDTSAMLRARLAMTSLVDRSPV